MLRIAICDDLAAERAELRCAVEDYVFRCYDCRPEVCEYPSGEVLVAEQEDGFGGWSLIFLDIFMDGLNGIETARRLREAGVDTPIIFLTTSPDFALESYEVSAFDYLLKPIELPRLERSLERFCRQSDAEERDRFVLNIHGTGRRIAVRDILYVECRHNDLFIYCKDGEVYRQRASMAMAEKALLSRPNFLKCHQSYLVNLDHVETADSDFHMVGGRVAPIRVRERKKIRDLYFDYVFRRQREEAP